MSNRLQLSGELIEIGRLEDENGLDGLVIRRADGSFVTVKGLRMDELRLITGLFFEQVVISIAKADGDAP